MPVTFYFRSLYYDTVTGKYPMEDISHILYFPEIKATFSTFYFKYKIFQVELYDDSIPLTSI